MINCEAVIKSLTLSQVNSSGELEITEDTVLGLIDHKIAEGKKEKNYEDMTIEEIDALEDDEDERVLQVSEQDS